MPAICQRQPIQSGPFHQLSSCIHVGQVKTFSGEQNVRALSRCTKDRLDDL
jgi:hypothetical protein